MPSTSSILNSILFSTTNQHKSTCCGHCHVCKSKEDSNALSRWFPRIRRRSSSSSSIASNDNNLCTLPNECAAATSNQHSNASSRRTSADYVTEIEDKYIEEFMRLYELALDELNYAIESQGSIYYSGDLTAATEATDNLLSHFQDLLRKVNPERSFQFQQEWTETLFSTRQRLDELPCPSTLMIE